MQRLKVECYSGYKESQKPVRFQLGESRYRVEEVLDRWYEPGATLFKIRADDGNVYIFKHTSYGQQDSWELVSFQLEREQ